LISQALRWAGVVYLLYLAWETWESNEKEHPDYRRRGVNPLFWRGFFSNLFNPKSIFFFISVVPGFIHYEMTEAGLLFQAARLGRSTLRLQPPSMRASFCSRAN
jgi:threonine/homoserine/homoserine lactone efflux protein